MNYIYATYTENMHPKLKGNPFVEALPVRLGLECFWKKIVNEAIPPDTLEHCDPETAEEYAKDIMESVLPTSLFYEVYCDLLGLLKNGYKGRNPKDEATRAWQHRVATYNYSRVNTTARSMTFIGLSGMGKTTLIDSVLSLIPPVIKHRKDGPMGFECKQISYIKINIPGEADLKQICLSIIGEIDIVSGTKFREEFDKKGKSTKDCISKLITICTTHLVGMIIFDEIQNICLASPNAQKLVFTLFDRLANEALVPTIKIGTTKANRLISKEFTNARRLGLPMDWNNYQKKDDDWLLLLEYAWEYQLLPEKLELTEEYKEILYEYTQGIPYCLFFMIEQANTIGIRKNLSSFSIKLFDEVYKTKYRLIRPAIVALRLGKTEAFDDLFSISNKTGSDTEKQVKRLLKIANDNKLKGEAAKTLYEEVKKILPEYNLTLSESRVVKRLQRESDIVVSDMESDNGEFSLPI